MNLISSSFIWPFIVTPSQGFSNTIQSPITQVQAYLATYALASPTNQKIDDIRVYRINNPNSDQIPYIAEPGDIITFDHRNDVILKNGEDITKEKSFIGDYFPLNPGQNTIALEPGNAIDKSVIRWRNKWL